MGLSQISDQWWSLFHLYNTLGWAVGIVVLGLLVYILIRYRHRPGAAEPEDAPKGGVIPSERGSAAGAILLTLIVTGILFPLTVYTISTVDLIEHPPEKGTIVVKVEGFQWGWKFTYPNGKQLVGELRIPAGEVVIFEVRSSDVFHNFGVVDFKVKADAIPGKVIKIWIDPLKTGTYLIRCFEFCGVGHPLMTAKVVVMEPREFGQWYGKR